MMTLRAGELQVRYENGFLRYIKAGHDEIIRMIYFALRDENWGTLQLRIENEKITALEHSFSIQYDAINFTKQENIFYWKCSIKGEPTGKITFEINGEALQEIKKNRAGFCVLHPIKECAGKPISIHHKEGHTSQRNFPYYIAPEDPFKNIKAMEWKVESNSYSLFFHGDLFETEDQRNWTDASYKTFCTPLEIPFPVLVKKGEQVFQKIEFVSPPTLVSFLYSDRIEINISNNKIPFAAIGLQDAPLSGTPKKEVMSLLQNLSLAYCRIDIDLSNKDWKISLQQAADRATLFKLPLELALHVSENFKNELASFIDHIEKENHAIKKIIFFNSFQLVTAQVLIDHVVQLRSYFPSVKLGVGTDFNFTELNRDRLNLAALDFVTYSIDPQEHATDDQTLIENLAAQFDTIKSAREIYPTAEIHVSPVMLKRRFNPYATNAAEKVCNEEQKMDARQATTFCAIWTLGSIKHLVEAGANSVTYYQTSGPLGIVSSEGKKYPVYDTFKLLSNISAIYPCTSSEPLKVDALADVNGRIILWNYTSENQTIRISSVKEPISLAPAEIRVLENIKY